jgi:hypothetical protein
MRRWLIDIVCALSLLLCLLFMAIWVRSFYVEDMWQRWQHGGPRYIKVSGGVISYYDGGADYGIFGRVSVPGDSDWEHVSWSYRHWRASQGLGQRFGAGSQLGYRSIGLTGTSLVDARILGELPAAYDYRSARPRCLDIEESAPTPQLCPWRLRGVRVRLARNSGKVS